MSSVVTWDDELAAYQRGEFLQLVLTASAPNAPTRYMLRQWFICRDNVHCARPGAARAFATEASVRAFIARHHSALILLPLLAVDERDVLAIWRHA